MVDIFITLLILIGIIFIVELPIHLMNIKKTNMIHFLAYIVMAMIGFGIGGVFGEYSQFTKILASSFIGLAFVSLCSRREEV